MRRKTLYSESRVMYVPKNSYRSSKNGLPGGRNDVERTRPANPVAATSRKVYLVHRPNSVQTTVALGNIAIERRSPDYIPMVVMNHILGGGVSGRLFLNLREEKVTPTACIATLALDAILGPGAGR